MVDCRQKRNQGKPACMVRTGKSPSMRRKRRKRPVAYGVEYFSSRVGGTDTEYFETSKKAKKFIKKLKKIKLKPIY